MVGYVKIIAKSKTLILSNLFDCHIDKGFLQKNLKYVDKLIINGLDKNAQYYNINLKNLYSIKTCFYMDIYLSRSCSSGLFSFNKIYITKKCKERYPVYEFLQCKNVEIMSLDDYNNNIKLFNDISTNENYYDKKINYLIE